MERCSLLKNRLSAITTSSFVEKAGDQSLAIFSAGVFMPSLTHLEITETIAELQKELR